MSISSSLFSGISGLSTNGNSMSVIGDNIANVNTIGFKSSRTTFQDVLSQSVATASGTAQIGRGSTLSAIDTLFQQGSFETTSNATDLAIGGNGFFIVSPPNEETLYYTRAGQFRFDADGNFVNPQGYVVKGWALDQNGNDVGTLTDIKLSAFTSPPEATSTVTAVTNLNSQDASNSNSLFGAWNANAASGTPIGDTAYGYQTAVRVYDALGNSHDITIIYDKLDNNSEYYDGSVDTNNTWEYIVTCNPDEDLRTAFAGSNAQGVLMRGTLTYNATTGALQSQTSYVYDDSGDDPTDPAHWTQAATFSTDGYPETTAQFVTGVDQSLALEFGVRSTSGAWSGGATTVADIDPAGTPPVTLPTSSWEPQALTSTQYASSSTTVYQTQNGYGSGFLESTSVGTDGIMVGHYSNGQILNLYRVGLARFYNQEALTKVGGNLWSATRASGDAITGHPGTNGLGSISPNSLEQSNVDIAAEFVKMITTQRGFQANSRIITTVDAMLEELINLKR
jgi:flagellar hook protein FlgE